MLTRFSLTFDSVHGSLVLVSDEKIVDDLSELHIKRSPSGDFECDIVRGQDEPVRLVAASTRAGRQALERANGRESSTAPGFVEVSESAGKQFVADDVAKFFGCDIGEGGPADGVRQPLPKETSPVERDILSWSNGGGADA